MKNIIGLSQEESAMFFGITRGQWSMVTIGKRDLPLEATIRLGNVLQYLKIKESFSETRQQLDKVERENVQHKLQQDYNAIKMKLYKVSQKISRIENIRAECFAALEVADFLENQEEKHPIDSLAESIRSRSMKTLKQHDLYFIEALQLKKESFEFLKATLEKKIKIV